MAGNQKDTPNKSGKARSDKRKPFWSIFAILLLFACVIALIAGLIYTHEYRERAAEYDLEQIHKLELPSIIFDRDGKEIGRIFVQNRSMISVEDVPDLFVDALRAGEDSRFETHGGIDYIGILRAVKLNFEAGSTTQGASTITQQLARNAYPLKQDAVAKGESGVQRKLVEAFLARRIEKRYSKQEILGFYLNRIYFGSGFYGLRSASLGYFGKEPKDLTLSECATIVGLIKNPTNNSPLNSLKRSQKARDMVLTRMVAEEMITGVEAVKVKAKDVKIDPKPLQRGTSHLYERVANAVAKSLGADVLAEGGLRIHTTISAEVQEAAQEALGRSLAAAERNPGYTRQKYGEYKKGMKGQKPSYLQGAVFMVDHTTGEVLAHVGGRDYAEVPYDFIEMGKRPLGTAFFPFVYAAGLAGTHSPASTVKDEAMDNRTVMISGREGILGEWGMETSIPKYEGQLTLRRAFENSKIAATVRLASAIGIQKILDTAVSFGLDMKSAKPLPRVSVGWEPASLKDAVTAISSFPLLGKKGPQDFIYVSRVEDYEGKIIFRQPKKSNSAGRVLDEAAAWQVHSMMAGGMENGSARGAMSQMIAKPFYGAGKGGTTHNFADTWFLGYNSQITCGVWTGFLQGNSDPIYPGAFSRDLAMPVWTAVMNAATPSFGGSQIKRPSSMVETKICSISGKRATQFCQEMVEDLETGNVKSVTTEFSEWFREEADNIAYCTLHSGAIDGGIDPNGNWNNLPVLDAILIRPKSSVLIGEDPYHTELPSYATASDGDGLMRRSTNVLDSLDLGDFEDTIRMRKPEKMNIQVD